MQPQEPLGAPPHGAQVAARGIHQDAVEGGGEGSDASRQVERLGAEATAQFEAVGRFEEPLELAFVHVEGDDLSTLSDHLGEQQALAAMPGAGIGHPFALAGTEGEPHHLGAFFLNREVSLLVAGEGAGVAQPPGTKGHGGEPTRLDASRGPGRAQAIPQRFGTAGASPAHA